MKKIRNIIITIVMLLTLFTLTSCKGKAQTFSSNGITITLTSKFKQQEISGAQIVYLTRKVGFMGNQENKDILNISDNKLEFYANKVVEANKLKDVELFTYDENGVKFVYGYYTAKVSNITYKYMLVTMEGKDNYYTMNFWSLEKNFNANKNQFMEWAKTIVVE